jgi:ACS family tartrate transporter-like MFS transporter
MPSAFLTGYAAASGIALINSVANIGGFVGPYAVGAISERTGSLHSGLAALSAFWFVSAALLYLLPRSARARRSPVPQEA